MSTPPFEHEFKTEVFNGTTKVNTGLFIGGQWVPSAEGGTIDVANPATGAQITTISAGTSADIDHAVKAAKHAYKNVWGLKVPGPARGALLSKLADLIESHTDELAALESLNTGKPFLQSKFGDLKNAIACIRYFAGWADKVHGQTLETNENKFAYTRHEPYGVVGQIIPWNGPILLFCVKIAPALACGNTIVIKPSEITPLTALRTADLINEAGFPPGVVNIVTGYGQTAGQAIAEHPDIRKVAFTGSTLTGRKIQEAASKSNLKVVSLELGGKSPNIIFDDADIEQSIKWAVRAIFVNMGQVCTAGSRMFVQEGIYDAWVAAFKKAAESIQTVTGDPFSAKTQHGPQISKVQYDRVMGYINAGKEAGATVQAGGAQHGKDGFFIQPTIFTDVTPDMTIMKEEIFGPVAAIVKFKTEEEVLELANDTQYGLACGVFTENSSRAIRVAHALEAGVAWVNCYNDVNMNLPFGGYKQSGIGREMGEYGLNMYTQVKSVYINLSNRL